MTLRIACAMYAFIVFSTRGRIMSKAGRRYGRGSTKPPPNSSRRAYRTADPRRHPVRVPCAYRLMVPVCHDLRRVPVWTAGDCPGALLVYRSPGCLMPAPDLDRFFLISICASMRSRCVPFADPSMIACTIARLGKFHRESPARPLATREILLERRDKVIQIVGRRTIVRNAN